MIRFDNEYTYDPHMYVHIRMFLCGDHCQYLFYPRSINSNSNICSKISFFK